MGSGDTPTENRAQGMLVSGSTGRGSVSTPSAEFYPRGTKR